MQLLLRLKCLRLGIPNVIISLLFILLYISVANATEIEESTKGLTLQEALILALNANPALAVAQREREAIEGVRRQADVRPNPTMSTAIQDTRADTRQISLQINQEIELGNKRDARIESANSIYNKATAELDSNKAEVHANVVAAFYEVLAAQARLALAKSSVEVASLALNAATKRVKAGKSSPVEETKSKIAESTIKIELLQARSQLNSSRQRLSALWGSVSPDFERADGDVTKIAEIAPLSETSTLLAIAPAIKAAKLEVNAREMMTNVERSKAIPNITISAGVLNNQELGLNQALLGLTVPIPLFNRNQGNLQEAVSRKHKAQDELLALENQLASTLSGQYERLSAARQAAISLSTEILPGAQSAFDAANKGFSAGKFNFLDVLDAQRTLFQAKSQHIQVLLEAHQAVAEIERILGDVVSHTEY
ncbi:MAG: TolC family protein [Methylophilaceae bacterium]